MIIDVNFFSQTHNFFKDVSKEYLIPNLGNLEKDQVSEKLDHSLVTQFDLIIENELIQYFKEKGFDIGTTQSCVTPVYLKGSIPEAMALVKDLRENYGIFVL